MLPGSMLDQENVLKVLTIVFTCTATKVKPNDYKAERKLLLDVFKENNSTARVKFFSDPLIKHLW